MTRAWETGAKAAIARIKNGPGPVTRIVLDTIFKEKPIGWEIPHTYGEEISV